MNEIQTNNHQRIVINKGYEIIAFNVSDFLYAKAEGNVCEIFLINESSIGCNFSMKELRNFLYEHLLIVETHRSYLVNLLNVVKIYTGKNSFVELTNKERIPISRRKKDELIKSFSELTV